MNENSRFKLHKKGKLLKFIRIFKGYPLYPKNIDYEGNPQDLCSLIRGLLIGIFFTFSELIKYTLLGSVALVIISAFAYVITLPFQYFISLMFFKGYYAIAIEPISYVIGVVELFCLISFLIVINIKRFIKYINKYKYNYIQTESKQPNVVLQYIKDKHNKVCRSIELIDD